MCLIPYSCYSTVIFLHSRGECSPTPQSSCCELYSPIVTWTLVRMFPDLSKENQVGVADMNESTIHEETQDTEGTKRYFKLPSLLSISIILCLATLCVAKANLGWYALYELMHRKINKHEASISFYIIHTKTHEPSTVMLARNSTKVHSPSTQ
jgi:hypothetical protein